MGSATTQSMTPKQLDDELRRLETELGMPVDLAEHLAAAADPGGGVRQAGEARVQEGAHRLVVEAAAQLKARDEFCHSGSL